MSRVISVPALECKQNNQVFYTSIINSKVLKEVCFISRRDEDKKRGFQRLLNTGRAKAIAKYLDENKGVIPSAIILSAQDKAKLNYDKENLRLTFSVVKDSFLVIDGQHRLYGLVEAKNNYDMPVVIFTNLNSSAEVSLFIDINTTQKGVPSALLLDIKQLAGRETKLEELQRELFDLLNKDSVLAGLLSASRSVPGKISRTSFNEATKVIFQNGPLSEQSIDIMHKALKNYLSAAEYVFKLSKSPNARLNKTVLFKALCEIFNEVANRCIQEKGNLKTESLIEIMEPISTINFDAYTGSNKATLQRIVADMRYELNKYASVSEEMF
jgi:DNA sulfur modification protein DndB